MLSKTKGDAAQSPPFSGSIKDVQVNGETLSFTGTVRMMGGVGDRGRFPFDQNSGLKFWNVRTTSRVPKLFSGISSGKHPGGFELYVSCAFYSWYLRLAYKLSVERDRTKSERGTRCFEEVYPGSHSLVLFSIVKYLATFPISCWFLPPWELRIPLPAFFIPAFHTLPIHFTPRFSSATSQE